MSNCPKEHNKSVLASSLFGNAYRTQANKDILNPYSFTFNAPLDLYDLLGLDVNKVDHVSFKACPCDCGPDVTQVVASTLSSITSAFQSVGTLQQLGACIGLFMPPYALDSWDMNSVLSFPSMYPAGSFCAPCNGKLTYNGGCYDASDINYIMFGHMFSLCNSEFPGAFPERDVAAIIATGKVLRGYPIGCSAAFGVQGYTGGAVSCDGSQVCRSSTKAATFNPSGNNWRWDGINN
jgi:hypothetical protein